MLFNSVAFAIFFPIVYLGYVLLQGRLRLQNLWLLAASYFFYGWWDWRFVSLLFGATIVAYICALGIHNATSHRRRRAYLLGAIAINVIVLGFFKYFNFFEENILLGLNELGITLNPIMLKIALPLGISFFVFQGLGYVIDVYRGTIKPVYDFVNFALFKAFFPQLVAGPIERATHMLPQITRDRHITPANVNDGLYLIVWGLYKKIVIADNVAIIANTVFDNYQTQSGADLLVGALAFTLQIYCDFSAYSDIARGIAKMLGFELVQNFNLPYLARNPSDFWRRWHISLSTWLRDYVYIPLGGNRLGTSRTTINLITTMLLGGLWHGAAWHFVVWGAYHGLLLVLHRFFSPMATRLIGGRSAVNSTFATSFKIATMFVFTVIGWIIFRGTTLDQIIYMISHISLVGSETTQGMTNTLLLAAAPLIVLEALQFSRKDNSEIHFRGVVSRAAFYTFACCSMMIFGLRTSTEFIYFQF